MEWGRIDDLEAPHQPSKTSVKTKGTRLTMSDCASLPEGGYKSATGRQTQRPEELTVENLDDPDAIHAQLFGVVLVDGDGSCDDVVRERHSCSFHRPVVPTSGSPFHRGARGTLK